jgi:hypothetical protein
MGKYGNKTINPLMREFSSNMGTVNDLQGLANVTLVYYKDKWDKQYAALNQAYDMLKPYDITTVVDSEETTENTNTSVNNKTDTKIGDNDNSKTIDESISNVKDSESTEIKNLVDTKTGTVSEDNNSTEVEGVDNNTVASKNHYEEGTDSKETTFDNYVEESVRTGSVSESASGAMAEVNTTIGPNKDTTSRTLTVTNNDQEKVEDLEHKGVEHTVTGDRLQETRADSHSEFHNENSADENESGNKVAVQPYMQLNSMHDVNESTVQNESSANTTGVSTGEGSGVNIVDKNLDMENTVDYSIQDQDETTTTSFERNNQKVTSFDNFGTSATYNSVKDKLTRDGKVVDSITKDDNFSEESTEFNNVDRNKIVTDNNVTTHDTTEEHTGTNTEVQSGTDYTDRSSSESNSGTSTEIETSNGSTVDTGVGSKQLDNTTTEVGNKWNFTNQGMVLEELELRKNNFYEMLLKDVATLLTLSVYA